MASKWREILFVSTFNCLGSCVTCPYIMNRGRLGKCLQSSTDEDTDASLYYV